MMPATELFKLTVYLQSRPSHITILKKHIMADETSNGKATNTKVDEASSVIDKDTIAARNVKEGVTHDELSAEIQSFFAMPFSLQNELRMFWTIVIFISILPAPNWVDLHPGFLMKGMVYFPIVGTLVGMAVASVFDLTSVTLQLPSAIAAATSTAYGWYLTGCLHEDGLCDTADGTLVQQNCPFNLYYACFVFSQIFQNDWCSDRLGIGGGWTRAQILYVLFANYQSFRLLTLYFLTHVFQQNHDGLSRRHLRVRCACTLCDYQSPAACGAWHFYLEFQFYINKCAHHNSQY